MRKGVPCFFVLISTVGVGVTEAALATSLATSLATPQAKRAVEKQTKKSTRAKLGAQTAGKESGTTAVIRTDGALVYSIPDFDGEVLTQLREGQQARVSQGTAGAVAKFHKIRVGPVLGYVAEIDVQVTGATKKRDHKHGAGKSKRSAKNARDLEREKMAEQNRKKEKQPFLFTRYVGLTAGLANYEEELAGKKSSESLMIYGLKVTGPDLLFQGPLFVLNLVLHYGAPKAYSELSITKPSGFFLLSDALLLVPLFQRDTVSATFGLGPNLSYRSFKIATADGFKSFDGFGVGLSLAGSAAYRAGDYAIRLEGKCLLDKRVDTIFQLSLQNEF